MSFSVCAFIPTTFMAWSGQRAHLIGQYRRASVICVTLCGNRMSQLGCLLKHLVSHVHLGEAKCLEMGARRSDGRGNGLHQQLLQVLAHKRPHLLQHLKQTSNNAFLFCDRRLLQVSSHRGNQTSLGNALAFVRQL